jgi:acylglycerol lipase
MGGLVAAYSALRNQSQWAGLILNSPLINIEWTFVLRLQAKLAAVLAWAVGRAKIVPAVRVEDMSQDPEVVSWSSAEWLIGPPLRLSNALHRAATPV